MKQRKNCTICKANTGVKLIEKSINLYHCGSCNHTFTLTDVPRENYLENYFSDVHKNWFSHPNYKLFEFIRRQIFSIKHEEPIGVLDVGCGNGDLLKYFVSKKEKAKLVGIDLAKNQKFRGINYIQGNFFKKKINGKFDVVCTLGTIEHIEKPIEFVNKISKLLNKNSLLIIMTIDSDSLLYWVARLVDKLGIHVAFRQLYSGHHLQHFTKDSLRKLVENNGFQVTYQKNHNFPLKSVDVPKGNSFTQNFYLLVVAVIFFSSSLISRGMLQTLICKKR